VSEGCRYCYAERISLRFGRSKHPWSAAYAAKNIVLHPDRLDIPRTIRKPSRIFVNSMSDAFHELVPDDFISAMFTVMNDLLRHQFLILTKRPERAASWPGPWTENIWMGTSIENARVLHRLDAIRQCGARVRFISFEPLLGRIGRIDLSGIHWVIVGGESGPNYRPMDHAWAREIRDQCVERGTPFFFKQASAYRSERDPYLVEEDGRAFMWRQYPGDMAAPSEVKPEERKLSVAGAVALR
jgi:protein gp37